MGRADLHVHTTHSDGMATVDELLRYTEGETELDVIAIADHDQVAGALEAIEWCAGRPGGRVQPVVATEISAAWGRHLLALFFSPPYPTRPFPRFRSITETVNRVADAGGLVIVPHPLSPLVPSLGARALAALTRTDSGSVHSSQNGGVIVTTPPRPLVGVELCSGVIGGHSAEARLRDLNERVWRLAGVGSSDAHHLAQLGSAYTSFEGRTPEDLLTALTGRTTGAHWGATAAVGLRDHARQGWRSLVVKPVRELHAVATGLNR